MCSSRQILLLERLDEYGSVAAIPAVLRQRRDQLLFERQADAAEVGRMLGLGIDADRPAARRAEALGQLDHFVERRDRELAVVGVGSERQAFARAERLNFREREILAEPSGDRLPVDHLRPLAIREALRGVGRGADLVLMAREQHAVFRRDEIGLDEVGAHLDGQAIGLERVLGPMTAGAAVRDEDRCFKWWREQCQRHHHGHRAPYHSTLAASCSWRGSKVEVMVPKAAALRLPFGAR